MEQIKFSNLEGLAKKYWSKFLLISDRDKLKMSMYPDRDWEHLMAFSAIMVLVFVLISGYLYLGVNDTTLSVKQAAEVSGAEAGKIKNTVDSITKSEAAFNELLLKKPEVKDPSI